MGTTIRWDTSEPATRLAVCQLCGWETTKGAVSTAGKRIAAANWDDMSPAARRVLERHGIKQ